MAGRTRHDVKKSETLLVFEDRVAWQRAAQDLGEYVIVIVGGHHLLPLGPIVVTTTLHAWPYRCNCALRSLARLRALPFSKRRCVRELRAYRADISRLAREEIIDRPPQSRIGDVMGRVCRRRQITAGNLVLALRTGLHPMKPFLNGILDCLIIAQLKMQEGMVFNRAPVTAEQGIGADKIDRAGYPPAVALCHDQKDAVSHSLTNKRVERASKIWPAPLARARLHVKLEEGVPNAFGKVRAAQPVDADSGGKRIIAFTPDSFALARGQRRKKVVEAGIARIFPMELLMRALEIAARAEELPFAVRWKCHMHGRGIASSADIGQGIRKRCAHALRIYSGPCQQPASGRRRERNRDLELRIVASARAFKGVGPAVIEDIFAARV